MFNLTKSVILETFNSNYIGPFFLDRLQLWLLNIIRKIINKKLIDRTVQAHECNSSLIFRYFNGMRRGPGLFFFLIRE